MPDFDDMLAIGVPVETPEMRLSADMDKLAAVLDAVDRPGMRPMTEADIPSVVEIENRSFTKEAYPEQVFRDWLAHGLTGTVVERNEKVAAYLLDRDDDKLPGFRLGQSLAVHPAHRREGLGETLMRDMMAKHANVSAHVDTKNDASKGMLKKLGFRTVRTFKEEDRRAHLMKYETPEKEAAELTLAALAAAANRTDTEPTDAQKEEGNYKKGRVPWKGLTLAIENPKGTVRKGKGWQTTMKDHYGYFAGSESRADGDAVDFFLNEDHLDSEIVFVVNQLKKSGRFDEHKCVLGCVSEEEAEKTYLRNYSKGWTGLGSIRPMTLPDFKAWLESRPEKAAAETETEEEFWKRNEAEKEARKDHKLGHIRDGYILCGCGFRYHAMPLDEMCPKCGEHITVRLRSMTKKANSGFEEYDPHLILVKRGADESDHPFTIAIDLDGTLAEQEVPFNVDSIGEPRTKAVRWARRFHRSGARIIIFTVRGDTELVKDWLDEHDVPYDFVNENPDQPPNSSGKVFADVYWDDRAFNAVDPDEHGPEILRRVKARGPDTDAEDAAPVSGSFLLESLGDTDDEEEDDDGPGTGGGET
jgi:ribosomal protein S18 acetylase RimI-like enzyme